MKRKKNNAKLYWIPAIALLATAFTAPFASKYFEITKNIEIFTNVYKEVNSNYVEELDPGQLMRVGVDAMLETLDPYTNYISEAQIENYRLETEGRYTGIGGEIRKIGDDLVLDDLYEGLPAQKAGMKVGDKLVKVNGNDIQGKSRDEVLALMKGATGTQLNLEIQRPGEKETREFSILKEAVDIPNVPYSGMVRDGIAYIKLTTFTPNAGRNVSKALKSLQANHEVEGVILDLRGNGGGLLREALSVCNVFVDKGAMLVSTRGKIKGRDRSYYTQNRPTDTEIPVAVLINKSSASASEIVSGAIQDLDRGVLIGQLSYGKGLVQNTMEVGYNSRVKVTTSRYFIPSGRCIQAVSYKDGEPVALPDSLRDVYTTTNGRKVLGGGGVLPDIEIAKAEPSSFLEAIKKGNWVFRFVSEYESQIAQADTVTEVRFEDRALFTSFLSKNDFEFVSETEKAVHKLREAIQKDQLSDQEIIDIPLALIQAENAEVKIIENDWPYIKKMIEREIVKRKFYEKGVARYGLMTDEEVETAVEILKDKEKYESILK